MTKVILDEVLRAKLNGLQAEIELCDPSGETVGHFLPENRYQELVAALAKRPYTDEDLARFRQETGGRTLAEIWKSLGQS